MMQKRKRLTKMQQKNCATRFEATHNAKGVWRKTRGRSTCGRRSREIQRQSCARDPRRICLLHQPQDPRVARLRPTRGLSPPSGRAGPDLARPPAPTGARRLGRPRWDRICRCLGRGIPHRMARQPRLILRQTKRNLSIFFLLLNNAKSNKKYAKVKRK